MHRCSVCTKICGCSGDTSSVVRLMELPGCEHCIGACPKHGVPLTEPCMLCVAEAIAPATLHRKPFLNGGW
jgi:hypothetical protein